MSEAGLEARVCAAQQLTVYVRAAKGDHDAQLAMARLMLDSGASGHLTGDCAASLALIWGRMAATSGKASHLLAYAGLLLADLSRAGDTVFEDPAFEAELCTALAALDVVADAGHELAALLSGALASRLSSSMIADATALKSQFEIEPLTEEERQHDGEELHRVAAALAADAQGVC